MSFLRKFEVPITLLVLVTGAAFLLKMCYLSFAFNCIFGIVFLGVFYAYVTRRLGINIPLTLMGLVFAALQVDALGNYFRMYGREFGPMHYDEFSHMAVQVFITPTIIWLVGHVLARMGYKLPLKLTVLFATTMMFSLSACYEIIELWDEVYFGGQRIWGPHDTAKDLQWNLCGIIIGTILALPLLKARESKLLVHSPAGSRVC
jgi:hypothetical protein